MRAARPPGGHGREGDPPQSLPRRWRRALVEKTTPTQRSLLSAWAAFGVTFGTARLITHAIRSGKLPWGNVSAGGTHLHHYNFGIAALAGVGLVAVRGDEEYVGHPVVAAVYGSGAALIADEFALLLDLRDVYWAKQGRISVDVSLGILSVLGLYLTAKPFWHELVKITHHRLVRR